MMARGPEKKRLDFDDKLDHITLRLRLTFHVTAGRTVLRLDEGTVIPRNIVYILITGRLVNSNERGLLYLGGGMRLKECPSVVKTATRNLIPVDVVGHNNLVPDTHTHTHTHTQRERETTRNV